MFGDMQRAAAAAIVRDRPVRQSTLPPSLGARGAGRPGNDQVPGVVVVFSGGAPGARALRIGADGVGLGRGDEGETGDEAKIDDGRISRKHARIAFDDRHCLVTDLASQNGTHVDGVLVAPNVPTRVERVIRVGDSLLIPCADIRAFERGVQTSDGFVRGPAMQALLEEVARLAQSSATLHVRGENGTGKEGIARAFHRARGNPDRTLIAVNCATIPHALAERLLFGARRGAYSGADADATGYVQDASGGTLFLDEIGELDLQVQAKLLRVLESRTVLPLGASKPQQVDFALCSATNKDLRALVAAGTLREDLYFRVGRPAVTLPALRNRPEEIPALIAHELARLSPRSVAHVSLVEQCLLRPWPGNVRELLVEVRTAASMLRDGNRIEARHLAATAGMLFGSIVPEERPALPGSPVRAAPTDAAPEARRKPVPRDDLEWLRRVEEALRANAGNVAATARALGLHRTQLRRILARGGMAADVVTEPDDDDDT
jgi:DNA-binding NtrC family response regulator